MQQGTKGLRANLGFNQPPYNLISARRMEEGNEQSSVKINHLKLHPLETEGKQSSSNASLHQKRSKGNLRLEPIRVTGTYGLTADPAMLDQSRLEMLHQRGQPPTKPAPKQPKNEVAPREQSASPVRETNGPSQSSNTKQSSPGARPNKRIKPGYEIAVYQKALLYQATQSYRLKAPSPDGQQDYTPMSIWATNEELKQFGLGVYLFFELLKRLTITLLLMSAVLLLPLLETYHGQGMSAYTSPSFSTTLAKFTLGHIQDGNRQSYLVITLCDLLSMLILLIFWLHWRSFHNSVLAQTHRDHRLLNPANYVVAVENLGPETRNLEADLKDYIDSTFEGAYEVEVVYNYLGHFDKFLDYDEQIELVERQHQIIKQTGKEVDKIVKEEQTLAQIEQQLHNISQTFAPLYAFIHFSTLKAKIAFLNHSKRFRLQNSLASTLQRALCCLPPPPQKLLFRGQHALMLRSGKLSRPEELNWRNMDITSLGSCVRWLLSLLFVVLAILITSSLIGLSTLYVSTTSSCQHYVPPTGTVSAQIAAINASSNLEAMTYCYCNANIASIYTDPAIGSFCGSVSNKVLITNALQISASIVSSVTNIILGIVIAVIAKYLLRPNSIPKQYLFIFWGVLMSNFINTAIIPLLLNGKILGVQFVSYLKFINFLNFDNLSLFEDFNTDWYALISPYYINFLIVASFVSPFIGLVLFALKDCLKHSTLKARCQQNDKEDPLVQKQANKKITSLQFEYPEESANVILLLFIAVLYSGLMPLTIPIITVGMFWIFICKKTILLKFSVKIAADETLNQSLINFLPFMILAHGLFSIWSHTADDVFLANSPIFSLSLTVFNNKVDRIFKDALMLSGPVLMAVIMIVDYTVVNFLSGLANCCKDEFQMPAEWAAVENQQFRDRMQKVNILGSYRLANNPTYGHAIKAYKELLHRSKRQNFQLTKESLVPQFST